MSKNTVIASDKAVRDFLTLNDFSSLEELSGIPPAEISQKIDSTFSQSHYRPSSIIQKISLVRSQIEASLPVILPRSKVRRELARKVNRKSGKAELQKEDIQNLLRYFTGEYEKAFSPQDKTRTLRNIILFKLLCGTSQRVNDVLTLTVEKAKKTSIYFKQEKTGNEGMIENPCLSEILLYLRYLNLEDHDFLFATSIYRKPLSKVQAWSIISRAGAMVLQKKLSPHSFRAYAVTHLKKLGYTNKEIKGITLHSSESMVEYYDLGKSTIENTKDLLL